MPESLKKNIAIFGMAALNDLNNAVTQTVESKTDQMLKNNDERLKIKK